MKKRIILWTVFSLLLILLPLYENGNAIVLRKPMVRISYFDIDVNEDTVNFEERFTIEVTITNDKILPVNVMIRLNLLDGILLCKKENLVKETTKTIHGREEITIPIDCIIHEKDIEGCKEKYNVQAVLYIKKPLRNYWKPIDITTHEILIRTKLSEKDKVKIQSINISSFFGENQSKFNVAINVSNTGSYNYTIKARVDLIEKSPLTITSELLNNFDCLGPTRRELGYTITNIPSYNNPCYDDKQINVICNLQGTDKKKERFNLQAVLLLNISGEEYQVDTSSIYEVYHEQPWPNEYYVLLIGIIIGGVLVVGLIIAGVRIIYPIYYMKRIQLKEKKEWFNKKRRIK